RRQEGDDGQQADRRQAHLFMWGAPRWPPTPPDARSAPGNPWRSSIIRVLIDRRGGPRDGPPASSSEGGYAPLGLPRPLLGPPRGTRGALRSSACSSIVVRGPQMSPPNHPRPPRPPPHTPTPRSL